MFSILWDSDFSLAPVQLGISMSRFTTEEDVAF